MPPPTECPTLSRSQPGPWAPQAPPASGYGSALEGSRPRPLRARWNSVPPGQSLAGCRRFPNFSDLFPTPLGRLGRRRRRLPRGVGPAPPQARSPPRPAPFAPPPPQPPARAGVPDPSPSLLLSLSPPSRCCHSGGSEDPGQSARSCSEPLLPQLNSPPRTSGAGPPPSSPGRRVARDRVRERAQAGGRAP